MELRNVRSVARALAIGLFMAAAPALADGYLVPIKNIGPKAINSLKAQAEVKWWIEAPEQLLVKLKDGASAKALPAGSVKVATPLNEQNLHIVTYAHMRFADSIRAKFIIEGGRNALVESTKPEIELKLRRGESAVHAKLEPFRRNITFATSEANYGESDIMDGKLQAKKPNPMLNELDNARYKSYIKKLSSYNRYTLGGSFLLPEAGNIRDAEKYLMEHFKAVGATDVRTQKFPIRRTSGYNVIADFKGKSTDRNRKLIIIGAHYDAISQRSKEAAPGAEDNGSGTAGLMELANIISKNAPQHDIRFIAFSGEEQGLVGSKYYVDKMPASEKSRIKGVITMDMIAFSDDNTLDTLVETYKDHKWMVDEFFAGAKGTKLDMKVSYRPFGSDHMPFLKAKIPTVLLIEDDWNNYPSYHKKSDTFDKIHKEQGIEVLKMALNVINKWAY